ncbi:sigma-54-dependent transcriptional regulator [Gimesia aquarii]|uniref:Transcriptional regulatory protein ZraR n=1 Tax=Gimesia aquarii TaxID=2527964 RepID=A0A517VZ84_9PLAN|nr:sigma-54 dependent transcriptional regulator [Gimesia aquarii]QDT98299.1 Transcriptional regulatory protein ZraR [Gimesia aquarii]
MSNSVNKLRVLFVDDEAAIREVMRIELPRMGHDVTICEDGQSALVALDKITFDAAIVDLRMPGLSGWDVVDHINKVSPETEVIISTGHGSIDEAIQAIRRGAYDFLPKPCKLIDIATVLQKVADKRSLQNKNYALESRLKLAEGPCQIVGETPPMLQVKKLIEKIAPTDSTALVLGETGTGKELVARRVHDLSSRASMPFVPVNCGALPENLVESELFGHRKGAFTGADTPRKGLIEIANGGTLFLDELGELDKTMQVKLLRFLESGEVRRVGDSETFHVDVRIVCATNRDLQEMVNEGTFREDLYFRVNTFEIRLPALRERKGDIPEISRVLLKRHLKKDSISKDILAPETIEILQDYDWKGNVRELANALEHAVILWDGVQIMPTDLPSNLTKDSVIPLAGSSSVNWTEGTQGKTLRDIEMEVIYHVLDKHDGDKPKCAAELGIALKTLYNKLNQYQTRAAG